MFAGLRAPLDKFIERATVLTVALHLAIPLKWKPDHTPVWIDQWPLPEVKLVALIHLVERELQLGHIEPSLSCWNTPVFVIQKASGSYRLLHDLRAVNAKLILFGTVQQGAPVLSALPRGWPLMVLDLKDCFFSIPLAEQDREAFAFTLPSVNNQAPARRFQWKVLPQGMACSPTICQLVVGRVLEPLRRKHSSLYILHYMDDLLIAAPDCEKLEMAGTEIVSVLEGAGFTISSEKIQREPGVEYLGYRLGSTYVAPTGLLAEPKISTLWDVQKLVGSLQWIRPALGIPPRLMSPFYEQLKGSDPNERREWSQDMRLAWNEIVQLSTTAALERWDPAQPLEGAVSRCEQGAAGVLGQGLTTHPRPCLWVFSTQPTRAFTAWLEVLALLITKLRASAIRTFGKDVEILLLPACFREDLPFPEGILLALKGFAGKIRSGGSPPIFDIARPLCVSLKVRVTDCPVVGPTVFTDASSSTHKGVMVWREGSEWQMKELIDPKASVQQLEARAVAMALLLWPTTPTNVVTDSAFVAKMLLKMGQEGVPSTTAAFVLEDALSQRTAMAAVLHVRSHSDVPGFFTEGNTVADAQATLQAYPLREAKDLHTAFHIGPRALSRACNIPVQQAREVTQACPYCNSAPALEAGVNPRGLGPLQIWQTDFTFESRMSARPWLAVTVDTASSVVVATQHSRVTSTAAQHHWATAIAVLGKPKAVKTDNGSCFTSKSTREWLARWGIAHTTGIPGNSQGQAIIERANRLLKDKIRVLAEGDGFMRKIPTTKQGEILAKALYALNHFERGENVKTPMQKHWKPTILTEGPPVKIRTETGEWERGWNVLVWGRGYAAVKNGETDKIVWIPSRKVKPDVNRGNNITGKDEVSSPFAGISDWTIRNEGDRQETSKEEAFTND